MATAIFIGAMLMIWLSDSVASFLEKNRMYEVLGLFILLVVGIMLLIEGGLSYDSYRDATSLRGDNALTIEEARILHARSLLLTIDHREMPQADVEQVMAQLVQQLQPYAGGSCRVILEYISHSYQGRMLLGEQWQVTPRDSLLLQLRQAYGDGSVTLGYHAAHNSSAAITPV